MAAVTALPALGQIEEHHETLEVTNEVSGRHCPALTPTSGGCLFHATSNGGVQLRKHVFGIETNITSCNAEGWGRVNEDAEGYAVHHKLTGAGCFRQPCDADGVGEPDPWPAHGDEWPLEGEQPIEGSVVAEGVFCIEPIGGGADESCEVEGPGNPLVIPAHQAETGHTAGGAPSEIPGHGIGGFRCELVGHGESEETEGWLENNSNLQKENIGEVSHLETAQTEVP